MFFQILISMILSCLIFMEVRSFQKWLALRRGERRIDILYIIHLVSIIMGIFIGIFNKEISNFVARVPDDYQFPILIGSVVIALAYCGPMLAIIFLVPSKPNIHK